MSVLRIPTPSIRETLPIHDTRAFTRYLKLLRLSNKEDVILVKQTICPNFLFKTTTLANIVAEEALGGFWLRINGCVWNGCRKGLIESGKVFFSYRVRNAMCNGRGEGWDYLFCGLWPILAFTKKNMMQNCIKNLFLLVSMLIMQKA